MAVGAVVAAIIGYNYTVDQVRIKGEIFGNEIERIQGDLTWIQREYELAVREFEDNESEIQDFKDSAEKHFAAMADLIRQYDNLDPPGPFKPSVDLFRLSTEAQLEHDRQIALWLETGDEAYNIRADQLHQESFSHELAALASFKNATLTKFP